jgi:hypothetical protein
LWSSKSILYLFCSYSVLWENSTCAAPLSRPRVYHVHMIKAIHIYIGIR